MAYLSRWDFNQTNKHGKFWHVLSTKYFSILFLWAMVVADFCHLDIYENSGLPLSTTTYLQYKTSFDIKIYIEVFYIQILFKCEARLLVLQIKTAVYRK